MKIEREIFNQIRWCLRQNLTRSYQRADGTIAALGTPDNDVSCACLDPKTKQYVRQLAMWRVCMLPTKIRLHFHWKAFDIVVFSQYPIHYVQNSWIALHKLHLISVYQIFFFFFSHYVNIFHFLGSYFKLCFYSSAIYCHHKTSTSLEHHSQTEWV